MLIPLTTDKAAGAVPQPGEQMALEVQDEDGNVLYRAIYDLSEAPPPAGTAAVGLKSTLSEETWPDAAFKGSLSEEDKAPGADAAAAVSALRLGWDIIKDNRAITDLNGASTAILNPKNMNPFDYTGAREGRSPQFYWSGYNWPLKKWKAFEIWLRVCGAYNAAAPEEIPPGDYIPSLYVDFPKSPWAEWGLTMNATAAIMSPWNAGPKGHAVAQCDVVARVTVSSPVDPSRPQSFKFQANGRSGFRRK